MTATTPLPTPLIRADELLARVRDVCLLDARFDLARPDAGPQAFLAGHLPGARHVHLDHDLSAKGGVPALCGGRHPLPTRAHVAATFGRLGIAPDTPVVVYDAQGGMFAARVWWMLRWLGHAAVAVLDGGVSAWVAAGGALEAGPAAPVTPAGDYPLSAEPGCDVVSVEGLQARLDRVTLIDARAPERYRGDVEPLDPVAGHIPGALNRPFTTNLTGDGRFQPPDVLRAGFLPLLGPGDGPVVHQCGSGVTACHNLLAMAVAGLPMGALYAGSWSEWCSDPQRPVARGDVGAI